MKMILIGWFSWMVLALVPVTIQVRYMDGSSFNLPIQIRSDDGQLLQTCNPDRLGRCTVSLSRGLYLIEPTGTQLDPLSAAAAAEIGGRWLAITVGDNEIEYSFVIDENAVYFDAAPNAARPRPIRPTQVDIDTHFAPEDAADSSSAENVATGATDSAEDTPSTDLTQSAQPSPTSTLLRGLLFFVTLTLGTVAVWWLTRKSS
jgi:hypothetical protein